ncbi:MAG: hypothetical protein ACJ8C4_02935 [Gemmataceae bacterium]
MMKPEYEIPPDRERQFDIIAVASERTLQWARERGARLEHIYPVVPFVETDFSMDAWLFFDSEDRIAQYRVDGSAEEIVAQFTADLAQAGYPAEWSKLVNCHFASKEVVDREYEGSYYLFLR